MKIKEYVPSLTRYTAASDSFITRAFVSAIEMAALGTPGTTIPIRGEPEHEFAAKRFEGLGIACLMSSDKMNPPNSANAVLNLLSEPI